MQAGKDKMAYHSISHSYYEDQNFLIIIWQAGGGRKKKKNQVPDKFRFNPPI